MDTLASFLRDVSSAWRDATQEHRNKLARSLFESVWVDKQRVLGVTPRPELKPFSDLQYSELSNDVLQWRPRPDSNRRSLYVPNAAPSRLGLTRIVGPPMILCYRLLNVWRGHFSLYKGFPH